MTFRHVFTFEPHVTVLAMRVYRGKLLIATDRGLYEWDGENETMQRLDVCCYRDDAGREKLQAYSAPWYRQ
jgi:hypothetical protein